MLLGVPAVVDVEAVVRGVLADVGYDGSLQVIDNIGKQSPDIAQAFPTGWEGTDYWQLQ